MFADSEGLSPAEIQQVFAPAIDLSAIDSSDELAKVVEELDAARSKPYEIISAIEAAEAELLAEQRKIEEEMQQKLAEIRSRKNELERSVFDARRALKKIDAQKREAETKLQTMKKAEAAANSYKTLEARWMLETAGAPWREFAYDLQLEAAKRMAYNHTFLLADSMGTGKTLQTIMALDLVAADTKDGGVKWSRDYSGYHSCAEVAEGKIRYGDKYEFTNSNNDVIGVAEYGECKCEPQAPVGETSYSVYRYAMRTEPMGQKILWYGPAGTMQQVQREFARWAPNRAVMIIAGMTKAERNAMLDTLALLRSVGQDYTILVNYEAGRRDKAFIRRLAEAGVFDTLVVDEAHNIKNLRGSGYVDIKYILDNSLIEYKFLLTGTPILNRPQELFSLLSLIDPENFYHLRSFLNSYCEQKLFGNQWRWVFRAGGAEAILKRMGHLYLRRTKKEMGYDVPDPVINEYELTLDPETHPKQYEYYNAMRQNAIIMLDPDEGKAISANAMIAVYTRLRQLITWPDGVRLLDEDGNPLVELDAKESVKVDAIIRTAVPTEGAPVGKDSDDDSEATGLVPEIVSSEKVVVFSQFNDPLAEIKRRCNENMIGCEVITGEVSREKRDQIIQDFINKPLGEGPDVLCMNYKVGGVGIDGLQTVCSQMIILDEEWNPGKRDQAYDRLNRFGQTKGVTIHLLRVKPSIDTWVAGIIEQKQELIDGFNEKAENLAEQMFDALKNGLI